jgi:hypothetical protein
VVIFKHHLKLSSLNRVDNSEFTRAISVFWCHKKRKKSKNYSLNGTFFHSLFPVPEPYLKSSNPLLCVSQTERDVCVCFCVFMSQGGMLNALQTFDPFQHSLMQVHCVFKHTLPHTQTKKKKNEYWIMSWGHSKQASWNTAHWCQMNAPWGVACCYSLAF